jgi:hypothetical protein
MKSALCAWRVQPAFNPRVQPAMITSLCRLRGIAQTAGAEVGARAPIAIAAWQIVPPARGVRVSRMSQAGSAERGYYTTASLKIVLKLRVDSRFARRFPSFARGKFQALRSVQRNASKENGLVRRLAHGVANPASGEVTAFRGGIVARIVFVGRRVETHAAARCFGNAWLRWILRRGLLRARL